MTQTENSAGNELNSAKRIILSKESHDDWDSWSTRANWRRWPGITRS